MHVHTADTLGNPNIGLYALATDKYCILGPEASHLQAQLEEVLQVPIIITTIAGTSLAGVFLVGNEDYIIAPNIIFDHEKEFLEEQGFKVIIFDTKQTALGNNISLNNEGILTGPMFSDEERNELERLTELPVHQFSIANIEVVGSSIVSNKKGGLIHRDASNFEQDMAQDTLRLPKLMAGTVNFGIPYVRSGIIANSNGFLIGSTSGGPEITNADEALGFIDL